MDIAKVSTWYRKRECFVPCSLIVSPQACNTLRCSCDMMQRETFAVTKAGKRRRLTGIYMAVRLAWPINTEHQGKTHPTSRSTLEVVKFKKQNTPKLLLSVKMVPETRLKLNAKVYLGVVLSSFSNYTLVFGAV